MTLIYVKLKIQVKQKIFFHNQRVTVAPTGPSVTIDLILVKT